MKCVCEKCKAVWESRKVDGLPVQCPRCKRVDWRKKTVVAREKPEHGPDRTPVCCECGKPLSANMYKGITGVWACGDNDCPMYGRRVQTVVNAASGGKKTVASEKEDNNGKNQGS